MEKKRYWLKLDKDFLKSSQVKVIKSMPNGKDYVFYYLSILLESLDKVGHLRFSDLVPYTDEMLASVTDTNVDIVRSANQLLMSLGLMERLDDGTIFLPQAAEMTGKESESAERVRLFREREKEKKKLQCNTDVTTSNKEETESNGDVTKSNDNKEKDKQRTENKEHITYNREEETEKLECVSVSETELLTLFETYEIKDFESRNIIIRYLNSGMDLEVIKNGLMIPFNRNVDDFDFEEGAAPINDPVAYGFTILANWHSFNVKTMQDVKKYNKLNRNRTEMIGTDRALTDSS